VSAPFFPRQSAGYCLDPNGETRVFAKGESCRWTPFAPQAFDGECEVYKSFGLKRVVQLRTSTAPGHRVGEIYLSQFGSPDGAYAMFTSGHRGQRVRSRPRRARWKRAARERSGPDERTSGRGPYLAEIQYANEQETPAQMKASSERLLVPIGTEIGRRFPPSGSAPSASKLPPDKMVPMGILYAPKDVLGVEGAGVGATGFYKDATSATASCPSRAKTSTRPRRLEDVQQAARAPPRKRGSPTARTGCNARTRTAARSSGSSLVWESRSSASATKSSWCNRA